MDSRQQAGHAGPGARHAAQVARRCRRAGNAQSCGAALLSKRQKCVCQPALLGMCRQADAAANRQAVCAVHVFQPDCCVSVVQPVLPDHAGMLPAACAEPVGLSKVAVQQPKTQLGARLPSWSRWFNQFVNHVHHLHYLHYLHHVHHVLVWCVGL